ncbi:hypothetical protein [Pacificitalea manganoxidans]|nr:hypothetical protein [Pacificitalea manganoxidans]MDR6310231.1 hypothetical protein [Pacificitalea manganoxidans]
MTQFLRLVTPTPTMAAQVGHSAPLSATPHAQCALSFVELRI